MEEKNVSYDRVSAEYQPQKVAINCNSQWDISPEEAGFLELTIAEEQDRRLEKRHASATDHADSLCL